MDKIVEYLPAILRAAAQSQLGLMALLIILLPALAFAFFSKASEAARITIFLFLFFGSVSFVWALFQVAPQTIEKIANTEVSTELLSSTSPGSPAQSHNISLPTQDSIAEQNRIAPPEAVQAPPTPLMKGEWLTYRYDIFWCDAAPQDSQHFAARVATELKAAGTKEVRIKPYDAAFRRRAYDQGFAGNIYSPASIRYSGWKEERAAKQAQMFLMTRIGAHFQLEEVDPRSPTPGILSMFLCPGSFGGE